ncbi:10933_t:CDS:2 [Cetraspora pellucida]|uniref:10933_t:CDS:1 n=1 Tax=Cetraspora pellucida TaxID=1433469 RepID=A0ACA9MUH3_9GLOM|nr:10933_t:CDS:2 [Cetraspora pellucida]
MNDRIRQLTRNYLDSLNLPYYQLDDTQKQEIIDINSQTEWIIFHSGSLRAQEKEYTNYEGAELIWVDDQNRVLGELEERETLDRDINISGEHKLFRPGQTSTGFERHPENYDLTTFHLKEICQEIIKIYVDVGEEVITVDSIIFMGGSGILGGRKQPAFDANYLSGRVKETNLNNLLNNNEITNSREKVATDPNQQTNANQTPNNSSPPPPFSTPPRQQPTTTRDLTFLIDHVIPGYGGNDHYIILSAPLVVEGTNIAFFSIQSKPEFDPLLQDGNQVIIRDVEFGPGLSEIDAFREEIEIRNFYRTIDPVSTAPPPTGGGGNSPPPLSFPDVLQKNHDLINEENGFTQLCNELKDIINKNKSVVQEAQTLGLTLPSFSDNALDFFQTAPFVLFDAGQPLNSPFNQQTSDKNDKTRQKALNLKNNIYQIYNSNVKKLNEKKQGDQGGSPPPENELTKLKKQAIEKINTILADPDNLRNIDLNTLASGKYRNWENDIMGLNTVDEANDYLNAFAAALKEKGVEEKELEEKEKDDNSSDHNSQKNDKIVDDKTKNFIRNLPLSSAKNVAKNKILKLFRKHRPDLEKLKEI